MRVRIVLLLTALLVASVACTAQQAQPTSAAQPLTLAQAEQMAIAGNPNITIAHLLALAQQQVTRETRSAELPLAVANLTAVDAHDDSRITAGALNNPIVYQRAGGGLTVQQLLTDFGRTHNLPTVVCAPLVQLGDCSCLANKLAESCFTFLFFSFLVFLFVDLVS